MCNGKTGTHFERFFNKDYQYTVDLKIHYGYVVYIKQISWHVHLLYCNDK